MGVSENKKMCGWCRLQETKRSVKGPRLGYKENVQSNKSSLDESCCCVLLCTVYEKVELVCQ
jgi:hypothetical protein